MNTQQFRPLFSLRAFGVLLFSALSLLMLVGCEEEGDDAAFDAELRRSNDCDPPCTGSLEGCFEDPMDPGGPAGCFSLNCPTEQPVIACADGATCTDAGQCVFDFACTPECTDGMQCSAGHCIPRYTSENVCDPLENCRNQCGPNAACVQACERDRSATCANCMNRLSQCRVREECGEPSASGCCSEEYCECFPGSPECSDGPPCERCWNGCQEAADPIECLAICAGEYPSCGACLQPFINQCADDSSEALSQHCIDLFADCTGSAP